MATYLNGEEPIKTAARDHKEPPEADRHYIDPRELNHYLEGYIIRGVWSYCKGERENFYINAGPEEYRKTHNDMTTHPEWMKPDYIIMRVTNGEQGQNKREFRFTAMGDHIEQPHFKIYFTDYFVE